MTFQNISPRSGLISPQERTFAVEANGTRFNASTNIASIVDQPRLGAFGRKLLAWRTPHLGIIQMYINPQNLSIRDVKDISANRTKAGFIIQYAGEKLTKITLSGTTGSSGIEGINILESIYRSEQEAFTTIAQSLERQFNTAQVLGLFKGPNNTGVSGLAGAIGLFLGQSAQEAALNIFEQPFPTLASLAANVELLYQGVVYRGYFSAFSVDERAQDGPGLFEYTLEFTAYAKQGVRRNFMPWHRQPFNPANEDANPLSFTGSIEEVSVNSLTGPEQPLPEVSQRSGVAATGQFVQTNRRDINNALGDNGNSLIGLDLEDTEV